MRQQVRWCSQHNAASIMRTRGWIDGEWRDAVSKKRFAVCDPGTNEEIAQVAAMGAQEMTQAVDAASHAFGAWKKTPALTRSKLLQAWHNAIIDHTDELALLASRECGKVLPEATGEVAYAAGFIDFYAHEAMHAGGFVVPSSLPNHRLMAVREPIGVCGIITPWNFPLAMITRKLGPCLAAGCTAVVKPPAETPLSALALAKLAEDVGIPPGVINVVPVPHERTKEAGDVLCKHLDVRKISFTGSTRVGKLLMELSSASVKRLSLELGGNAPFIVFKDADIDAAVDGIVFSKFRNTGQTCVCTNRVFVHETVFKEVATKLVERVGKLKMGQPRDPGMQLGPMINDAAIAKTSKLVDDAKAKGAQVLIGGRHASQFGPRFYEPTVLSSLTDTMAISTEEIFGPVVPLFKFASEAEVLKKANSLPVGLAGYFYSQDLSRVWRVAAALEVGMVGINTGVISFPQAPFGGVKQSGLGREGSKLGIDEYTETKLMAFGGLQ